MKHMDKCSTPFGHRQLREWVLRPLASIAQINARLDAVTELMQHNEAVNNARSAMSKLPDLERLLQKIYQHAQSQSSEAIMYENVGKKRAKDFFTTLDGFKDCSSIVLSLSGRFNNHMLNKLCTLEPDGYFPDLRQHIDYFNTAFDRKHALKEGEILPDAGVNKEYDDAVASISSIEMKLHAHLKDVQKYPNCRAARFVDKVKERYQIELDGK
jgi:DNA mismatch repair protein MSH6